MTTRPASTALRLVPLVTTGLLTVALTGALAACSPGGPAATGSAASPPPATPARTSPAPSRTTPATCVESTMAALTPEQRRGQLLMVGFDTNAALGSLDEEIGTDHVGNVIYLGGWEGADKVTRTSTHLQGLVSEESTGGVGLLVAADQEGGEVHQLRGEGFTRPPTARDQARMPRRTLVEAAAGWAREMAAAGVNVNLAPVTDTVPEEIGRANEPIGRWGRQYGSDPETVEGASTAFIEGMLDGGVQATVKHFPGLGRIRSNTDFSSTGITDGTTTAEDPYLEPFRAGVEAGAGLVMVGSADYSRIDAGVPAMFSARIVTGLLRGELSFDGVVITDDVNAAAVASIPPASRAVRVIQAGGDVVLTGDASVAREMLTAIGARAESDERFAARVDAAVLRVLTLKDRMGLLPCSEPD